MYDARKSIRGTLVEEVWPIKMIENFDANHDYDLIVVSVQHYHFEKVADFLADKIGRATVLVFNNFWDEPAETTVKLPQEQLVWGFPQAGGGFDNKGVLKGSIMKSVTIGTFGTEPTASAVTVMDLFKSAGFKINLNKDFRSWLFGHFAVNAALHIETMKTGSNMMEAFQSAKHRKSFTANGKELIQLLKAPMLKCLKCHPSL